MSQAVNSLLHFAKSYTKLTACFLFMLRISSYLWLGLSLLAFFVLPSRALDYGLAESTADEIHAAMGYAQYNLSWFWFALPWLLPILAKLQRPKWNVIFLIAITLFVLISAKLTQFSLGYSSIVLFITLTALLVENLAKLQFMQGDRFIIAAFIGMLIIIGLFIVYPTGILFSTLFYSEGQFNLSHSLSVFSQPQMGRVILNSLSVSGAVGLLSTFFGLLFALYTTRIGKRTRFISKTFSMLPIVTPPFVVGLGIAMLFGRAGYVTEFLVNYLGMSKNWLYGFNGIAISHTLALTPMAFMIIEGALKAIPATLEEAGYTLHASRNQTFFYVLLPLLKPALANAFLITFIQSLADFSTPFVLGGDFDVLASQIYFYMVGANPDYAIAATLGSLLLLVSLAIFFVQHYWLGKQSYVTQSGKMSHANRQALPLGIKYLVIVALSCWALFNLVLYGSIFFGSFTVNWGVNHSFTFENYQKLFGQGIDFGGFPSLIQTVLYALCAAPITALVGLLLAYLTTRKTFKGRESLAFLTLLCFAVPGTVAGVSYLLGFNQSPIYLTGTSAIIVLSMVTRNMPVGMRSAIAALNQIDKSLEEAAFTLKANGWKTLVYVVFPLLKPALLSALVSSFVRSMTTISAIIFLVTPTTRVATSYILNRVEDGDYGLAIAYGATLIVTMMSIILIFNLLLAPRMRADGVR